MQKRLIKWIILPVAESKIYGSKLGKYIRRRFDGIKFCLYLSPNCKVVDTASVVAKALGLG